MKFAFACALRSNFVNFSLFVDFVSLNESIKFQIEYFVTLIRTIKSHASQFFEKFNLSFRFVFVIVLSEQTRK